MKRLSGRLPEQMRTVRVTYDLYGYAQSSVLFELGTTKVLCAISLQNGVPHFLKGKKTGWLTAEYAMLPSSTTVRTSRDTGYQKNGRNVEISRLIGRALRSIVDLSVFGEHTVTVDCDVLQADGGTRTASITAACLALALANKRWLASGKISATCMRDLLVAVSVGMSGDTALLDLDFQEDSTVDADFNFVLTKSGALVEVQGTAELKPVLWSDFDKARLLAQQGAQELFKLHESQRDEEAPLATGHFTLGKIATITTARN